MGWYSSRHQEWTAGNAAWMGDLVGVADYNHASLSSSAKVIVRIDTTGDDYFVGFNRASGLNSDTSEGRDTVTVTSRPPGSQYDHSWLRAKLNPGQSYSFTVGGVTTVVNFLYRDITASPQHARVQICTGTCPTAPTPPPAPIPAVPLPVQFTTGLWKYLADGSNQGTSWRSASFNDALWQAGFGQFGYGDNDEGTDFGSSSHATFYFRKPISLGAPVELSMNLLYDDAAIVYVNGAEVSWRIVNPRGHCVLD